MTELTDRLDALYAEAERDWWDTTCPNRGAARKKAKDAIYDAWPTISADLKEGGRLKESARASAEALWQLLDDMGDAGHSVCPAAKEMAQEALVNIDAALKEGNDG